MTKSNRIKKIVDLIMTIGLLFLMAYQVTGELYHEWIGAGMLFLFLIHNILNYRFYKNTFKGSYTVVRILSTVVNMAVLAAILVTGYSGIVMSNHVFSFLHITGGTASARVLHLAGSYWSFVLMGIHLGLHWRIVTGIIENKGRPNKIVTWILGAVAITIALYGAVRFYKADIYTYMFMKNPFAFLDYNKAAHIVLLENLVMMGTWVTISYYLQKAILMIRSKSLEEKVKRQWQGVIYIIVAFGVFICTVFNITGTTRDFEINNGWNSSSNHITDSEGNEFVEEKEQSKSESTISEVAPTEEFILIQGGTFEMGSLETENWRNEDEVQHSVTVSDFYISSYELTQKEYTTVMNENPSGFIGDTLPVENVSWIDAVKYCNERSKIEGLTVVYDISETGVRWNRSANGYRLPTEAEWEYACRAGTVTPFNTETSISAEESNYYGHYPYEIEGNYFNQNNLTTKPGQYRETTLDVDSFEPNAWGLYNMHGNVGEWVWDTYGAYSASVDAVPDPTGANKGNLRVYRGGGWNDFAKNMRSAYRATMDEEMRSFNIGIRLVRNSGLVYSDFVSSNKKTNELGSGSQRKEKVLIAYYSWSGNTKGVAEEIQAQTGADLFEITLEEPYSNNYNTVLEQAQHDQNIQARPNIVGHVDHMDEYDVVLIGYPNWWASIPMPIASFLEEYDFSGKRVIPFCSHGGGRFGQSQTAIVKLVPDAVMGEGLSIHYSGGATMKSDVSQWLRENELLN